MIHFLLVVNRQGKVRLVKFYSTYAAKERTKLQKEAIHAALQRREKLANFIDFHEHTLVYKRYASLFFVLAIDKTDNELIALELIHSLVMLLDRFFQNVCELDIVYNFDKVHWLLDEFIIAGEQLESCMQEVLRHVEYPDAAQTTQNALSFL
jgi:AP-1 complex subunit sigma 1/2